MATILGLHAPRLEIVRTLLTKRGRLDTGRYAVEGPTMLGEAIRAGLEPEAIYATQGAAGDFRDLVRPYEERLFIVPDRAMARISDVDSPPGIVGTFALVLEEASALLEDGAPVAVLAGVSDPGNAGTLLRTAEIFGIGRALFVGEAVEPHNSKVLRATMGAIFRMRLGVVAAADLVRDARNSGYRIVAAGKDGTPLPDFTFPSRCLIAIGHERHGVGHVLPICDDSVTIPQRGAGESLNAAIAGGIIFYAFSQQSERRI